MYVCGTFTEQDVYEVMHYILLLVSVGRDNIHVPALFQERYRTGMFYFYLIDWQSSYMFLWYVL